MITTDFVHTKKSLVVFMLPVLLVVSCVVSEFSSFGDEKSNFPEDSRVDRSFITREPCEAPCWYGLILGKSNSDVIRKTLQELPFVDQPTVLEQEIKRGDSNLLVFHFDCVYYHPPGSCGVLTSENGKLSRIVMAVQYPLTIKLLIDQLGIPENYTVDTSSTEDICILNIYWPKKNVVAVVEEKSRAKHCSTVKNEPIDLELQTVSLVYIEINDQQDYESRPWPDTIP